MEYQLLSILLQWKNCCCQEHKTIVHLAMVLVFVLFSRRVDTTVHVVDQEFFYIALTNLLLAVVINHENDFLTQVNFLLVMLCVKIPTLDKYWNFFKYFNKKQNKTMKI